MGYTVVFTDHTPAEFDIERSVLDDIDAEIIDGEDPDVDLTAAVAEADALISSHFRASEEVIATMDACQVISRTGIGVDYIDLEAATNAGITVTNVPDYCIDEVSNHALSMLLALQRYLLPYHELVMDGEWTKDRFPVKRLQHQTLGLVAFGSIAQSVNQKVQSLGMTVLAYDPYCPDEVIEEAGAIPVDIDTLLHRSDVVSVHAPLTEETEGLLDAERLRAMKAGSFIINTARGGLIEQDALVEVLDEGHLAGAGLDVFEDEPLAKDHPLREQANTILTPHMGYYSIDSIQELRRRSAENVRTVLLGDVPEHVVNPDVYTIPQN